MSSFTPTKRDGGFLLTMLNGVGGKTLSNRDFYHFVAPPPPPPPPVINDRSLMEGEGILHTHQNQIRPKRKSVCLLLGQM